MHLLTSYFIISCNKKFMKSSLINILKLKKMKAILPILIAIILLPGFESIAQNINHPNKTGPMGVEVNTRTGNLFLFAFAASFWDCSSSLRHR